MPKFPVYGIHRAASGGRPYHLWGEKVQTKILHELYDINIYEDWAEAVIDWWIENHPYYDLNVSDVDYRCCGMPGDAASFTYSMDAEEVRVFFQVHNPSKGFFYTGQTATSGTYVPYNNILLDDLMRAAGVPGFGFGPNWKLPKLSIADLRIFNQKDSFRREPFQEEAEVEYEPPSLFIEVTNCDLNDDDYGKSVRIDVMASALVDEISDFTDLWSDNTVGSGRIGLTHDQICVEVLEAPFSFINPKSGLDPADYASPKDLTWIKGSAIDCERYIKLIERPEVVEEIQGWATSYTQDDAADLLSKLNSDYEHQTSDDAIIATIEANEYLFNRDGEIV